MDRTVEDTLEYIFDLVNSWLKFAEAKNSVLVAISGTALWATVRVASTVPVSDLVKIYLFSLIICLSGTLVIALVSFLPVLNFSHIIPKQTSVANRNLLYFGYLATFSKKQLVGAIREKRGAPETDYNEFHPMLAEQIIINSRIAMAKYALFELGIGFMIVGALTPILGAPLLFVSRKSRSRADGVG